MSGRPESIEEFWADAIVRVHADDAATSLDLEAAERRLATGGEEPLPAATIRRLVARAVEPPVLRSVAAKPAGPRLVSTAARPLRGLVKRTLWSAAAGVLALCLSSSVASDRRFESLLMSRDYAQVMDVLQQAIDAEDRQHAVTITAMLLRNGIRQLDVAALEDRGLEPRVRSRLGWLQAVTDQASRAPAADPGLMQRLELARTTLADPRAGRAAREAAVDEIALVCGTLVTTLHDLRHLDRAVLAFARDRFEEGDGEATTVEDLYARVLTQVGRVLQMVLDR